MGFLVEHAVARDPGGREPVMESQSHIDRDSLRRLFSLFRDSNQTGDTIRTPTTHRIGIPDMLHEILESLVHGDHPLV
jgi:hypothetical protein